MGIYFEKDEIGHRKPRMNNIMEDGLSQNVNNKLNELFPLSLKNAARILSANTKDRYIHVKSNRRKGRRKGKT